MALGKYHDLDKIPPHRQALIEKALREFKKAFGIKSIPVDCVQLILRMVHEGPFRVSVKSFAILPAGKLASTIYIRQTGLHLVAVNKNLLYGDRRPKYPFRYSSDRMLNFTLAHEIAHMALGHFELENQDKDDETKELEDLEANEFAGRLLMPEDLLLSCNFKSITVVAAQFMVSEQAILKRLSQLNRHDIKYARMFPVCQNCGTPDLGDNYGYCPICGIPLDDSKGGIITMKYTDGYNLDEQGRVTTCPRCGNSDFAERENHCRICGLYLYNSCTGYNCGATINDGNARYCSECGSPTTFLSNGLLKDWLPSREMMLNMKEFEEDLCSPREVPRNIEQPDWDRFLSYLSANSSDVLAEAMEGSHAKLCGRTLVIFVRELDNKHRIDKPECHESLLGRLNDYLQMEAEEVRIAAYEEFVPEQQPSEASECPF